MQLALKEGFALKSTRIWFHKFGTAKYISHLDLNRCVARAFHKAKLPMWYTEGFNPHAFVTFALPLSLGVEGKHESMDIRLLEDMPKEEIIHRLNDALPKDIRVYDVTEPQMKPGKIAYADYEIRYAADERDPRILKEELEALFAKDEILVEKKTKSGIKIIHLNDYLDKYKMTVEGHEVVLNIVLPAGSTENINPSLIGEAIEIYLGYSLYAVIIRSHLYDAEFHVFA